VALEDGHGKADLARVLDHDGLRRLDGPVDERLHVGRLQLGHHSGQVSGFLLVHFVGHDLDAEARGQLLHCSLPALPKPVLLESKPILEMPIFFICSKMRRQRGCRWAPP